MICYWGTRRQYIGQPCRRLKKLNVCSKGRWIVSLPGAPWYLEPAWRYSDGVEYDGTLRLCVIASKINGAVKTNIMIYLFSYINAKSNIIYSSAATRSLLRLPRDVTLTREGSSFSQFARFEVLTVALLRIWVLWDCKWSLRFIFLGGLLNLCRWWHQDMSKRR
jgi:hypothetical protein